MKGGEVFRQRPRPSGIIAVELRPEDSLVGVALTRGADEVMLFASNGKSIRFAEDEVRPMGRAATGVRGITLGEGAKVVGLLIPRDGHVLTATSNGYVKRTPVSDYPLQGRSGQGVISIQTTERNGPVVGAILVGADDELMLISDGGTLVRTAAGDASLLSGIPHAYHLDNERFVSFLQALAAERGIEVVRDFEEMPSASLDRHKVLSALINLVTNARQSVL